MPLHRPLVALQRQVTRAGQQAACVGSPACHTSKTVPTVQKPCTTTIMTTRWLVGIVSMASVKATCAAQRSVS